MSQIQDTDNLVRLVGIDNRFHVAPVYICPKFDPITNEFTIGGKKYKGKASGDAKDAPIIAEGTPLRISDVDSYRFAHLQSFNMTSDVDRFLLSLAKDSEYVAESKSKVNPTQHRYYIENKEEEAEVLISKSELIFDAMGKIKAMSLDEMIDFARLVEVYTKGLSKKQVEAGLLKVATDTPKKVIDTFNDANRKVRTFLKKLVASQVIKVLNGKYTYGNELIGINEDYAIEFLKDTANNALITQWNSMLKSESAKTA